MKRFLALIMSALLAGCGTQEYAKPPGPISNKGSAGPSDLLNNSEVLTTESNSPSATNGILTAEPARKGHAWRWLEWYGVNEQDVDKLRCRYRDTDGVKAMDAFGAAIEGGVIIGIVVRASGSVFFGKPVDDHHGHGGHGGHGHHGHHQDIHVTVQNKVERSVWGHLNMAIRHATVAGINGGVFVGGCQTILAGGNWTSFDGLLGHDFAGLSAATALGIGSYVALRPWIRRLFGDPPEPKEPTMDTSLLHVEPPPLPKDGKPPKGPGVFKRLANWSAASGFNRGVWYYIMPEVAVVFLSERIGVMVYNKLTKDAERDLIDAPYCEAL